MTVTSLINNIEMFTDNNLHTEAVVALAMHVDSEQDIQRLQGIVRAHEDQGYLTFEQVAERSKIRNRLLERLDPEECQQVARAF